ncbi:MAG: slipin family protein [Gemmatimonadales bacterium]
MGLEILVAIGIAAAVLILGIRVITEYERGVVFRFGRFNGIKEAGLRWIIPGIDRMVRISLREIVMDVPEQDVITRDNVSVKVNAVLYFRVLHPDKAVIQVENYLYGTSQLAQTTLRSVCGQAELDELLAERESINQKLQEIIDLQTEPWGVKVRAVELKKIDLATEMQRPMARQAEAEREKRAKVIHAEGELQAAERLAEAARVLASEEVAIQLRYLQTLSKIATEHNSTTIFPVPIDIHRPFYDVDRSNLSFDESGRRPVVAAPLAHSDRAITASTRTCCSSIVRVRSSGPPLPCGGARLSTGGRLPHRVYPSADRRLRRRSPALRPRNR